MELPSYYVETLSLEGVPLEVDKMFMLCFAEVLYEEKKYLADVYLEFKKDIIADNYLEVIDFFAFIDAFIKKGLVVGHENSFFKVCQKDKISYLKCKFTKNEYFLSTPMLKTMLSIYGEFRAGNTLKHLTNSTLIFRDYYFGNSISCYNMWEEKKDRQEITEYLEKYTENYQNLTLFDTRALGCYNMIKYRNIKKQVIEPEEESFFISSEDKG